MPRKTLEEFIQSYGNPGQTVAVSGDPATQWPTVLVRFGDKAAMVQFMGVAADDPEHHHLCIDVHPFVDGAAARASAFGMEPGRRWEAFTDTAAAGTSYGLPAMAMVSVLVGTQGEAPAAAKAPVHSCLDLSTAHLPEELGSEPGLNSVDGVTAYSTGYGWLMWVPEDPDAHAADYGDPASGDGVPEVVLAIQRYARQLGCNYVLFDGDAEKVSDLPTWKW